jgi:hypothetical protein
MIVGVLFAAIVSAGILMVPAANGPHPLAVAALAAVVVIGWVALIRLTGRGDSWEHFERDFWAHVAAVEHLS